HRLPHRDFHSSPTRRSSDLDYGSRHPGHAAAACFGVAGPVVKNRARVTHLGWTIEAAHLARKLKLKRVHLINDLVANGYGLAARSEERRVGKECRSRRGTEY